MTRPAAAAAGRRETRTRPPLLAVVGPTATGKTALAVALAQALNGEVVNADAMQAYRSMDVGTATPTDEQRAGVPHHLFDLWSVTQAANVADYQRAAQACVGAIRARGRLPVLVGGSGLYVRAVVDEIAFPGTDPAVRRRLEDELAVLGPAALHDRLAGADPAAAAAILPSNGRRLVRALEVVEITGRPFSATLPGYADTGAVQVGLDLPDEDLDARVAERTGRIFDGGLLAEVQALLGEGLRDGFTAPRAIGYREALAVLDGALTEDEARALTAQATRRLARRQRSWFRRDPRVRWLDAAAPDLRDRALAVAAGAAGGLSPE